MAQFKISIYDASGVVKTSATVSSLPTTSLTGTLQAAQEPAHTGDVTNSAGSLDLTLATVNSNVGSYSAADVTVNAKGLITAAASGASTGTGDLVRASSPTIVTPTIASFVNAGHDHSNAAGGGVLADAALPTTLNGHSFTGANDFNAATMRIPVTASALTATQGYWKWDSTDKCVKFYDGTRERALGWGYQPFAQPAGFSPTQSVANTETLAAVTGTIVIPVYLHAHMLLQSVQVVNQDAASARTWGWDLYVDLGNAANAIARVATSNGNESYTATVASVRTLAVTSAPVYLPPGAYYLAVQNRHATNTFGLGKTVAVAFGFTQAKTKTTGGTNGSTLDIIAATWAGVNGVPAVNLRGRAAADTSAW